MTVKKTTTPRKTVSLKSDADFAKLRASIHRRADTIQNDIHRYLVAVCAAWSDTGDSRPVATRINTLIDDMPKGIRCNAMREWVERYMKLTFCTDGDNEGSFIVDPEKGKAQNKGAELDMSALTKTRWFEMKPEKAYQPLDLAADLQKLLKAHNARSKVATVEDNIPSELLQALNTVVADNATAYQH